MSTINHEVSAKPALRRRPGGEGEIPARSTLLNWREKRDIEQDRELYHRDLRFRAQARSHLAEDNVAAKEAVPGPTRGGEKTAKTGK